MIQPRERQTSRRDELFNDFPELLGLLLQYLVGLHEQPLISLEEIHLHSSLLDRVSLSLSKFTLRLINGSQPTDVEDGSVQLMQVW